MNEMPQWWSTPSQLSIEQSDLFTEPLGKVLARERIGTDELDRWHNKGWLSFSHTKKEPAQWQHVAEIRFVKQVARSGLSDVQIDEMFRDLPRPLRFRSAAIAYSYEYGWVEPVVEAWHSVVSRHVADWVEAQTDEEDWESLRELRSQLEESLLSVQEPGEADVDIPTQDPAGLSGSDSDDTPALWCSPNELISFKPADQLQVKRIEVLFRRMLTRQHLRPEQIAHMASLLHALERLPVPTPEISVFVAIKSKFGDSMRFQDISIDDDGFRVSAGGWHEGPAGGDSYLDYSFTAGPGFDREALVPDALTRWTEEFAERLDEKGQWLETEDSNSEPWEDDWCGDHWALLGDTS